jgi:hypothetical protein
LSGICRHRALGYKIPFTVFAVFDKAADGAWSLVHIHFAV